VFYPLFYAFVSALRNCALNVFICVSAAAGRCTLHCAQLYWRSVSVCVKTKFGLSLYGTISVHCVPVRAADCDILTLTERKLRENCVMRRSLICCLYKLLCGCDQVEGIAVVRDCIA